MQQGVHAMRTKGFTLLELMVSMALGFILLAGAFEMHAAFSRQSVRQQEVADMQQSLRIAAQVIGRAVRTAGTGLNSGILDLYDAATNPTAWTLGAVQFSNSNVFPNGYPATIFDKNPGDQEAADPDWLRVVSFDATPPVNGSVTATNVTVNSVLGPPGGVINWQLELSDVRAFPAGAFIFVYNGDYTNDPTNHRVCARRVTQVIATNANSTGRIAIDGGSQYNPVPANDACLLSLHTNMNVLKLGYSYAFGVDRSVIFRITPGDPPNAVPRNPPRLRAWYSSSVNGNIPAFYPEAVQTWQTLTENVSDLQLALLLGNGTLCGDSGNSIDDSTGACPSQNIRGVRMTVVATSNQRVPGWIGAPIGPFEDEVTTPADGFLRRALTVELQVRNIPWGGIQ